MAVVYYSYVEHAYFNHLLRPLSGKGPWNHPPFMAPLSAAVAEELRPEQLHNGAVGPAAYFLSQSSFHLFFSLHLTQVSCGAASVFKTSFSHWGLFTIQVFQLLRVKVRVAHVQMLQFQMNKWMFALWTQNAPFIGQTHVQHWSLLHGLYCLKY